jgi:predicted lipoprotein with Yx(FWY)xxD motif
MRQHTYLKWIGCMTAAALLVLGSAQEGGSTDSDAMGSDTMAAASVIVLSVGEHDALGSYLVDAEGRTLYVVVDGGGNPVPCEGPCAEAWPPFLVEAMGESDMGGGEMGDGEMGGGEMGDGDMGDGEMGGGDMGDGDMGDGDMGDASMAGAMVDASAIGTVRRPDGTTQVTFAGHPLYYFVNDVLPGEVNCQAVAQFGGTWYVLSPDGAVITTSLTAGQ